MFNRIYKHLRKYYHLYSFSANTLMAVSMAGLTLLGVLNDSLAATVLFAWGITFAAMFGVGKLLDQEIDDLDKTGGVCNVDEIKK